VASRALTPTHLTNVVPDVVVETGHSVVLTSVLTNASTSNPIGSKSVQLRQRTTGGFSDLGEPVITDSTGQVSMTVNVSETTIFEWVFPGDTEFGSASSPERTVRVHPTLSARGSKSSARRGESLRIDGGTQPPLTGEFVMLQRFVRGGWQNTGQQMVLDSHGDFVIPIRLMSRGTYTLRVRLPASARHTEAFSGPMTLTIG
jgi:hypothetical protein